MRTQPRPLPEKISNVIYLASMAEGFAYIAEHEINLPEHEKNRGAYAAAVESLDQAVEAFEKGECSKNDYYGRITAAVIEFAEKAVLRAKQAIQAKAGRNAA